MTPEQGARYQRLLTLWMEYWETGNNFGGRYFRDFDLEADLQGAIGSFCDEVNGWVGPTPKKVPKNLTCSSGGLLVELQA